jgi:4-hydroxybutyrate dehydrogenase
MALIHYLTRIRFADRVIEDALSEDVGMLGIRRPLLVADADAASDLLDRVLDALPVDRPAPPVLRLASDAAEGVVFQALSDAAADGIIALGGIAALSLARHAAAPVGGIGQRPLIAVPATTRSVGIEPLETRTADGEAMARPNDRLPDVVLCDPTVTLAQGAAATAAAGMDALAHCIEAYLGTMWNPPADGIALDGVRRAREHLVRAVEAGDDREARRQMMAAALDAGLSAQKGLGAAEALADALEEMAGAPHGRFHAALLPAVLAFNRPAVEARLPALAGALGAGAADAIGDTLAGLAGRIALPSRLDGLKLSPERRIAIARRAAERPAARTNPRHATAADYVAMLESAGA